MPSLPLQACTVNCVDDMKFALSMGILLFEEVEVDPQGNEVGLTRASVLQPVPGETPVATSRTLTQDQSYCAPVGVLLNYPPSSPIDFVNEITDSVCIGGL